MNSHLKHGLRVVALALVVPMVSAACGGDDEPVGPPPPPPADALVFSVQPADATAGAAIIPRGGGVQAALSTTVEIVDENGDVVTDATNTVTMSIGNNAGGGALSGTTSVGAVNGIASFPDLAIDKVGTGYTLSASAQGLTGATSDPFDISPGPAAQLAFATQPADGTPRQNIAMSVEIQDAFGNLVPGATNSVTIDFEVNSGSMLLHASGSTQRGNPIYERVDPTNGFVVPVTGTPTNEVWDLKYDASTGQVIATDWDNFTGNINRLFSVNPTTGVETTIGTIANFTMVPFVLRPITFVGTMLVGGVGPSNAANSGELYQIDPATGAPTLLGTLTVSGDAIALMNGLATDPTDGTVYGAVTLASAPSRQDRTLVTIDVGGLMATVVGPLSELGVAGLAFLPDGALLAVTGDGAGGGALPNPTTLWEVDTMTGAMTMVAALGNGGQGEAIGRVPAVLTGTTAVSAVDGVASFTTVQIDGPGVDYVLRATASGLAETLSTPFTLAN